MILKKLETAAGDYVTLIIGPVANYWTRRNVLWFASKIYLAGHLCNVGCIYQTRYAELNCAFVKETKCSFLREKLLTAKLFN